MVSADLLKIARQSCLCASLAVGAAVGCVGAAGAALAQAPAVEPLKVEGAAGLDRRVLTRPEARLVAQPGGSGGRAAATFSHYYVFETRNVGGKEWLRVGADRRRSPGEWVAAEATIPWKQAIILSFNQRAERQPVLFFERRDALEAVAASPDRVNLATSLISQAASGAAASSAGPAAGPAAGVVALEPRPVADFHRSFYMLPIIDFAAVQIPGVGRRGGGKLVKVASVNAPAAAPAQPSPAPQQDFRTAVVFVVDTTKSMQPYIDRTRKMVRHISQRIAQSRVGGGVNFGLVAFRGDPAGRPGVEYLTKIAHPLEPTFDVNRFQRAVDELREAPGSTASFAEDGLAGVQTALKMQGWGDYAARFLVYVSDAPFLEGGDAHATTGVKANELASQVNAPDRLTAIMTILLETPQGKSHHGKAQSQFRQLSRFNPTQQTFSFPIPEGNVDRFGDRVDALADAIINMTEQGQRGALRPPSDRAERPADPAAAAVFDAGYAMQLAWMGNRRQTQAPAVSEGWAVDVDLADPSGRPTFDINVLLTRSQLNDLYQALDVIEQTATARLDAPGGSRSFFAQLRQVLATAQADPTRLQSLEPGSATAVPNPQQVASLQDLITGFVRHLPYQSPLLGQSAETLEALGPAQLSEMRSNIQSKRSVYKDYFNDADRWIKLTPGAPKSEEVYPVPLVLLP